ncbi:MAG: DUF3014 domain-containing protein [Thermoanaerobaculia bacterium]|nr:DUF3014 domain-containing protein [Thermoanaerobaculia bacterium]
MSTSCPSIPTTGRGRSGRTTNDRSRRVRPLHCRSLSSPSRSPSPSASSPGSTRARAAAAAGGFTTLGGANEATVDPASFRRHDLATAVFTSLDTAAAARLHRELTPLIDIAWSEIGEPGRRFDDVLATAIGRLVAVQVPDGPVAVVADGAVWQYADPALAALPAAEKHLLRLGPDNARAVQAKLRELAAALGLSLP